MSKMKLVWKTGQDWNFPIQYDDTVGITQSQQETTVRFVREYQGHYFVSLTRTQENWKTPHHWVAVFTKHGDYLFNRASLKQAAEQFRHNKQEKLLDLTRKLHPNFRWEVPAGVFQGFLNLRWKKEDVLTVEDIHRESYCVLHSWLIDFSKERAKGDLDFLIPFKTQ